VEIRILRSTSKASLKLKGQAFDFALVSVGKPLLKTTSSITARIASGSGALPMRAVKEKR